MVRRQNRSLSGSLGLASRVLMAISRRKGFASGTCYQALQDVIRYALTEDLERDPIGQMRGVYEALALPDFAKVEPALGRYVDTL
jgi:hypothetical protein